MDHNYGIVFPMKWKLLQRYQLSNKMLNYGVVLNANVDSVYHVQLCINNNLQK